MNRAIFFNTIFQNCEGYVELRVFGKAQKFFKIGDIEAMDSFCQRHRGDNIYFGVCTRDGQIHNGTKGGKDNIASIPAVWCDIDFKETSKEVARQRFKSFPFKPTIIIQSGNGIHSYWLLKEPEKKTDSEKIEEINRRITNYLGGDFNSCDIARVLRPPETFNQKYNPPAAVTVLRYNKGFYCQPDDFLDTLPRVNHKTLLAKTSNGNPEGWLFEALKGVKAHNPGRDTTGAKIAGYFIDKLNYNDLMTVMLAWDTHNQPPLGEKDIKRIVSSVRSYRYKKDNFRSADEFKINLHFR